MCAGNDFQHQNNTAFLSGPYVSAGALSVTAENFEQAMVVHAARRLPKATWLNDRDQFMQPNAELSKEFISDCTIWSLFSNSNQTASLKNVVYEKETYQVRNHFFPFLVSEVKNWRITDTDISITLAGAEDTFVAKWLLERDLGSFLSAEAKAVLEKGKEIYQFYFAHLNVLRSNKFKIEHWDAGWWQIKQVLQDENLQTAELKALKALCDQLKEKLLPQLGEYGIVR